MHSGNTQTNIMDRSHGGQSDAIAGDDTNHIIADEQ